MFEKHLIIITGPTAVGKTALSIETALNFSTEIISADSRQFYKEMNIGTAKPSAAELQLVQHHFINSLSVQDEYNVSKFETQAIQCLEHLFLKHDVVVMTGGSGLYINAVCYGFDSLPDPDQNIRSALHELFRTQGIASLQNQLEKLDPVYFREVDKQNPHRLIRAVEVSLITGKPYSSFRKNIKKERFFKYTKIGLLLPKEELYARINKRTDMMIENGLEEEAKKLLPFRHLRTLETVGYTEMFEYLENKISLTDAIAKIKINTKHYAKRQLTWFKKDKEIIWFSPEEKENIFSFLQQNRVNSKL